MGFLVFGGRHSHQPLKCPDHGSGVAVAHHIGSVLNGVALEKKVFGALDPETMDLVQNAGIHVLFKKLRQR